MGYLDDSTWIAPIQEILEQQFIIANSFYKFMDIKINHDKYEILTNVPEYTNKTIDIVITPTKTVKIKTASRKQGKRILGVYINVYNSPCQTINKMKEIIYMFHHTIKFKKITHDYLIYIVNKALIPKLEYVGQTIF
jgi:hypothetical protein